MNLKRNGKGVDWNHYILNGEYVLKNLRKYERIILRCILQ